MRNILGMLAFLFIVADSNISNVTLDSQTIKVSDPVAGSVSQHAFLFSNARSEEDRYESLFFFPLLLTICFDTEIVDASSVF